jgi:acetyltransferase-like isoleucine patch superfamily enzyme
VVGAAVRGIARRVAAAAAIGPNDPPAAGFGGFGEGTSIGWPSGPIFNERYIRLGSGTLVAPHVTLSVGMVPGQRMVTDPVLVIGDRCLLGRGTAVVAHLGIELGDDVYTGVNVYITDQNHGYEVLDEPIGVQRPREAPVTIGAGSWIGAGAVILPGTSIGRHVVVAANAVVRGEVPDRSVVAGVPARVVRFHDGRSWQRPAGE